MNAPVRRAERSRWLVAALVLVVVFCACRVASAAPGSGTIRVALLEAARVAEFRGEAIDVSPVPGGGCDRCPRGAWQAERVRAAVSGSLIEIDGRRATGFRLTSERPIRLNGHEYPSVLELVKNGDGMAVVNELPLEDYVAGVVKAEANERWPLEALRAQAIVARTYAAYHRLVGAGKPYHIVASTANQQYAGRVPTSSPAWAAVQETSGQVLRWDGDLFPAFYHAESGGYTEDPRTVFAAKNLPALKPIVCRFSAGSPHFYWNLDLRLRDLGESLRRAEINVGQVTAIEVTDRTASLRATVVTVRGTRGTARLRGNDFRRIVGYDTLKSTLFAVAVDGEFAHFSGRGYGHGVGLCQWGAKGMAEQGYRAPQILEYYYPGAVLGVLSPSAAR